MIGSAKAVYSATLLTDDDHADLGPVDVPDAIRDDQARELARDRTTKILQENGIERGVVRVTRGGFELEPIEVFPAP
jgi:hypothetical protein